MKKQLITFAILLFSITSLAQSRKGFTLSPHLYAGACGFMPAESGFLHGGVGLDVKIMFNNYLGLGLGIRSSVYSFFSTVPDLTFTQIYVNQSMVEFPLYFNVVSSKHRKVGVLFNLGILVGVAYDQEATASYIDGTQETINTSETTNEMHAGITSNFGLHLPIGKRFAIEPSIYANAYATDLYQYKYNTIGGLSAIGLSLNFPICLGKMK